MMTDRKLYRPSIANRFTNWVEDQPYPPSLVFLIIGFATLVWVVISRFMAGILPAPITVDLIYEVFADPILIPLILAIHLYVKQESEEALKAARSISSESAEEFENTRYRFLNVPAFLYATTAGIIALQAILNAMSLNGFEEVNGSNLPLLFEYGLASALFGGQIYFLIHILFQTVSFYRKPLKLNIFNLGPIFELPTVGAKLGLFLVVFFFVNMPFNINEEILSAPTTYVFLVIISVVPLLSLLLPLAIINRQLTTKKMELISQTSLQIQEVFDELDTNIENKKYSKLDEIKLTIDSLTHKKEYIENISTWPWKTGTFRVSVSAVILPILVFVIQETIRRFLN